jgi:hypothetical protein
MDCRKFESRLERFLTERLPPASMQECRAHLKSCSACRKLMDLAKRKPVQIEPVRVEEFVQAVLEKTSGKSCSRAHELLPDYVDGALAAASRELIGQHLENCHSCQQICQALEELKEVLPGLAQMDPGSSFTGECMDSFRRLQNQPAQLWIWPGRIWGRLLARPRLAWESAYILTLLLFVVLKLGTFIPGSSPAAAISTLQTKSAQIGVSIADTFKKNINEWSLAVADRQYRWAKSSSKRKEEVFSTIVLVKDKTRQYSRSTSNAVIRLPHSIWNGIVGNAEKILPKDRATT